MLNKVTRASGDSVGLKQEEARALLSASAPEEAEATGHNPACWHCGTPCADRTFSLNDKVFCCQGCQLVHEVLAENGLGHFYDLRPHAGTRVVQAPDASQFQYLDEPVVRQQIIHFSDGKTSRVTFLIPAIHCIACVWLLENLFRLHPGIGASRVNFPRKEVAITFTDSDIRLSELVRVLNSIGYAPTLKLADLEAPRPTGNLNPLYLRIGVAGFAFGNIMLLSFPSYLGMDPGTESHFKGLFGIISLVLSLPVLLYSASDYWRSAWLALRQQVITIEVPIALGITALFGQSAYEILSGRSEGYLDSLAGLLFYLLCGKLFQQKTFARLSFDRDYKSFFPLSVLRKNPAGEETVALSQLRVGDRLVLRHGELIPADARLVEGAGRIDYSFVTGESEPIQRNAGDYLYAGGQQLGGAIVVEMVKPVSQSYLTSLWSHETFRKRRDRDLNSLTNVFSRRFTWLVIAIAVGSAVFWSFTDPARGIKAFTSVLIVACPCALALAAPFALGNAQRVLARRQVFLKNPLVLETLAQTNAIVFDKTGTLTAGASEVDFRGTPLNAAERRWVATLARQSTHPHARRLADFLGHTGALPLGSFQETTGQGIEGVVDGHTILLGSKKWLESRNAIAQAPEIEAAHASSTVWVAIDGQYRGVFLLGHVMRPEVDRLIEQLGTRFHLALLSGDHPRAREQFRNLFGPEASLWFNQNPLEKLEFIRQLQQNRKTVVMVGDGLNDAGALRQSDVGIAVVEKIGAFSPASDVIMEGRQVPRLHELLNYSRQTVKVVRASFLISSLYNVVGISIAAAGLLAPIVCAILMPLSSVSVVAFACGLTHWLGRRLGNGQPAPAETDRSIDLEAAA